MKKSYYQLVVLFLATFFLHNNNLFSQKREIKFEHISIEQGLSQSSVTSIAQDSRGFMWFGTLDGLNRYNGYEFTVFQYREKDTSAIADNAITALAEDKYGRLWIGTQSQGICVYNKIKNIFVNLTYKINPNDVTNETCLSNNTIKTIKVDLDGVIWVGTANGLNKIVLNEGKILTKNKTFREFSVDQIERYEHFFQKPNSSNSINSNVINNLNVDKEGHLWVATNNGVNRVDRFSGQITSFRYSGMAKLRETYSTNKINAVFVSSSNLVWVGTDNGVFYIDPENKADTSFAEHPSLNLNGVQVSSILEDKDGVLWFGTEKSGIKKFSPVTGLMDSYTFDPANQYSLSVDNILTFYQSSDNVLWVGTSLGGINKWDRATENILLFRNNPYNKNSISSNQVRSIFEDSNGELWLGTVDGGLNRFDRLNDAFTAYQHNPSNANSLSNNHVRAIAEGKDKYLWIGTDGGGLNRFNKKTGEFKHYLHDHENIKGLSDNKIWDLFVDDDGLIWIGTQEGGLNIFDPATETFTVHKNIPDSLWTISDNHVTTIYKDSYGIIWIGTFGGGLNRWDAKNKRFVHYKHYDAFNDISIGHNRIYSITEDTERVLWIGAKGSLNRFNRKDETFEKFTIQQGLPNNTIMGILEDSQSNLWISTNRGISKYDKKNKTFKNYDVNDGLQSNEFLVGSFCKTRDGEMWFGGIHGVNAFYPERIRDNKYIPKIVITRFLVSNVEIELDSNIAEKRTLYLNYDQKDFSFEYVALNYIYPEKSRYAYMMVGKDNEWKEVGNWRFANYTNMEPGQYEFKVIGSNSDEIWNEEGTSIFIYIKPPFWKTKIFIAFEILSAIFLVLGYVKMRTVRLQREKVRLEQNVKERTIEINQQKEEIMKQAEQLESVNKGLEQANEEIKQSAKMKEMFLANTSHEIRTPLNIIIGFTNLLLNTKLVEKQKTYLKRIKTSSSNLLVIINDILDFSKIEAGKLSVEVIEFDFREVITNVVNSVLVKANEKDIKFWYHIENKIPQYIYGDPVRLNQILINLIGNAIKFTPSNGMVNVRINMVEELAESVRISFKVIDTGIGMTEEQLSKIFESFTQASSDTTRKYGGTGLGLAIVKRLVELQDGTIKVESEFDKGSVFSFELSYKKADGKSVKKAEVNYQILRAEGLKNIRILLVDDNEVNRALAIDTINMYNESIAIDEAANGKEAVDKAKANTYDMIIMDLQMPEMDGFSATTYIRTKLPEPKCKVPILAMSAHAMKEEKQKCYAIGMNDYLTKPFVPEDLFAKIETLTGNIPTERREVAEEVDDEALKAKDAQEEQETEFDYLDLSVLNKTYKGDKSKINKILTLCKNNIPSQISGMRKHHEEKEWKSLRTVAHSLKTSLNYLGLKELKDIAKTIEMNAAQETELDAVPDMVHYIETIWEKAAKEIDEVLSSTDE